MSSYKILINYNSLFKKVLRVPYIFSLFRITYVLANKNFTYDILLK